MFPSSRTGTGGEKSHLMGGPEEKDLGDLEEEVSVLFITVNLCDDRDTKKTIEDFTPGREKRDRLSIPREIEGIHKIWKRRCIKVFVKSILDILLFNNKKLEAI